jgi:hypothetical protein
MDQAPTRFTIRPDDYHVPYVGTAGDGRRFLLSEELFKGTTAWVGLFLWKATEVSTKFESAQSRGQRDGLPGKRHPPIRAVLCKLALLNLASMSSNRSR